MFPNLFNRHKAILNEPLGEPRGRQDEQTLHLRIELWKVEKRFITATNDLD